MVNPCTAGDSRCTVLRNVGTDWAGAVLADWAPGGTGWRRYVGNGHGDKVAEGEGPGRRLVD